MHWPRQFGLTALCAGCLGAPEPIEQPEPPLFHAEPLRDGLVLATTRLHITSRQIETISPSDLALFEGSLTENQARRVRNGELPAALVEKRAPIVAWRFDSRTVRAAPVEWFPLARRYTVAARGHGVLGEFDVVADDLEPRLQRLWPPEGHPSNGLVVWCGEHAPPDAMTSTLEPGPVDLLVRASFGEHGANHCVAGVFEAAGAPEFLVAPPMIGQHLIDPEPIAVGVAEDAVVDRVSCEAGELAVGPACARVEDDRLLLRPPAAPLLWRFEWNGAGRVEISRAEQLVVMRGLPPERDIELSGAVFDVNAVERERFSVQLRTLPARARVVINEVLGNPIGPEPASEWVELYNDGTRSANLGELRLFDSSGGIELPDARLDPGAYVVLVRDDFPFSSDDVPPAPNTVLLRVPQLAKNGITNAGERLVLVDDSGAPISFFPARGARKAGVSIARQKPEAPDSADSSFGEHGEPGASPGGPNVF